MRSKLFRIFAILVVVSMIASPVAARTDTFDRAQPETPTFSVETPATQAAAKIPASETGLYVVRLADPSLAAYEGGLPGLAATSPQATGERLLDVSTPASQAYLSYLETQQAAALSSIESTLGRPVEVAFQYLNVLNALAIRIDQAEAQILQDLPGITAVYPDALRELDTDVTPELLGAWDVWEGETGPGVGTKGEGIIIGVIDTGINSLHPSFSETDSEGYTHTNPYGPGVYKGVCDPADPNHKPDFCNEKLIGAYSFHPGTVDPEDINGHGSHTASTAAGNIHDAVFDVGTDTFVRPVSGMAPHANVIAYLVCYPSCPQTSTVAAVDQGIADGVHVLNYSISGSDFPWTDITDLAFLEAYGAGILVSASAGNAGPGAGTVAKTGPWNASVGGTTHGRIIANTMSITGPGEVPPELVGMGAVTGDNNALVEDIEEEIIYDPDNLRGCSPFEAGYFTDKIALIERGDCTFAVKVANAANAGAIAVVVFNNAGGPPITMGGLADAGLTTPAVFIARNEGLDVMAFIDANPNTTALLTAGAAVVINPDWQDLMYSSSSRGPSRNEILKPDYNAPAVNILAAVAAEPGEPAQYGFYQGTSMAAPHGAGAAALLMALYPDWSPAEVKSALASTAFEGVLKEDALTPADLFDRGSGRIDIALASRAGLVFDETYANYVAANPAIGGDPKTLNQPSVVSYACIGECSWTRTVRSTAAIPATYTASYDAPAGVTLSVDPDVFTIDPGATQELVITANVSGAPLDEYAFGNVILETDDFHPAEPFEISDIHVPVVVIPAEGTLPSDVSIVTTEKAGMVEVPGFLFANDIPELTFEVFGLTPGLVHSEELFEDPTNNDPYNGDGTYYVTIEAPAGAQRLVAEITYSEAPDADLFVGTGDTPSAATQVCASTTASWEEYCNVDDPAEGTWWVLVQNWQGSTSQPDLITLSYAVVPAVDEGNMTVDGPLSVPAGQEFSVDIYWDEPALTHDSRWYAAFTLGSDAGNPGDLGRVRVDLTYLSSVTFSKDAPAGAYNGDVIPYVLSIGNGSELGPDAAVTDYLPPGVEFAGNLVASQGEAVYDEDENAVFWTNVPSGLAQGSYQGSTSAPAPVNLTLESEPVGEVVQSREPLVPQDAVSLILDDGTFENNIGIGGTLEFIYLNRFTPDPELYPFALDQIQVYFNGGGSNVQVGDDILLVVYENTSGNTDPAVGSNFLASYPATVEELFAWNVYNLAEPVQFDGPGDVLIGVIALEVPGTSYFPAALDTTASQQRSWAGWWAASPPPTPPTLPPTANWILIDSFVPGNWGIRGFGETEAPITISFDVTVTGAPYDVIVNVATLTFDDTTMNAQAATTVIPRGPAIEVSPEVLAITAVEGYSGSDTLTISNVGDLDLVWSVEEEMPVGAMLLTWSDDFDSYETGSDLHGQGGWKGWFNDPGAGALTSDAEARSLPNSAAILGDSDLVHEYSGYTSGQWIYTAWQFVPTDFTGTSYFIMLNTYNDAGVGLNWSTQVQFVGSSVINTGFSGGSLPMIKGEWVELRVEIDLDADTQSFYYGGELLYSGTWTDEVSTGGILNIGAVDLFANGASVVYYDDLSLLEPFVEPEVCELIGDIPWLSVAPDSGTTAPGESDEVIVTVDGTDMEVGDIFEANLCVFSNDPATPLVVVPVTVDVEEVAYGVDLSAEDDALSGEPGTEVEYLLTVTNAGNIPDTFDLTFEGNLWDVVLEMDEISLDAGESAMVSASAFIPLDAGMDDMDEVTVTATSQGDPDTFADVTLTTTVVGDAPVAGFTYAPAAPEAGEEVVFTNTTTGTAPITYLWDFGDGATSTAEHPTHTYAAAGIYVVTLTATNAFGEDTHTETIVVAAIEPSTYTIFLPIILQ